MSRRLTYRQQTISTHAPVKGATRGGHGISSKLVYFNPRSREGSDSSATATAARAYDFNPRSREGSDLARSMIPLYPRIFQPTLP